MLALYCWCKMGQFYYISNCKCSASILVFPQNPSIWKCIIISIFLSVVMITPKQWPKVYDLCHTFLHVVAVALVKKNMAMRQSHAFHTAVQESHASHAFRVRFSHGRVFFYSCNVQKRATKSDTSAHCLITP